MKKLFFIYSTREKAFLAPNDLFEYRMANEDRCASFATKQLAQVKALALNLSTDDFEILEIMVKA